MSRKWQSATQPDDKRVNPDSSTAQHERCALDRDEQVGARSGDGRARWFTRCGIAEGQAVICREMLNGQSLDRPHPLRADHDRPLLGDDLDVEAVATAGG